MRAIRCCSVMAALIVAMSSCSSTRDLATPTTAPTTSAADTTNPPATTSPETTPPETQPPDTDPPATAPPDTQPPDTTPATTTRPIVAIDDNGDAVIVAPDGTKTLLFDGTDPDDPPPLEGEVTSVNGIAVLDDLSLAFISDCCEPVPGTMFRTIPPAPATYDSGFVGYGNAPALSPDQTRLVRPVYDQLAVTDLDLNNIATVSIDIGTASLWEAIFVDADTVVALTFGPTGAGLTAYDIVGSALVARASAALPVAADSPGPSFAGTGDGVVYVLGPAANRLSAFDATTLAAAPASDITLPRQPLSAWVQGGEVRWVGDDRVLHVGDAIVPGAFIWVR